VSTEDKTVLGGEPEQPQIVIAQPPGGPASRARGSGGQNVGHIG
jgi:hypothetical protein